MGLIQRVIEQAGIATIGISIVREYSEQVKPPRTVFLRWPFGHPLGEPHHQAQQRQVMRDCLDKLYTIATPGTIVDLPYIWRRHDFRKET
ncbi:MAG: hypothetical protein R6V21_13440 [Pelovirga sp.]